MNGNVLLLAYDVSSRLTSVGQDIDNNGTADRPVTLAYDGTTGHLQTLTAGSRTVTYRTSVRRLAGTACTPRNGGPLHKPMESRMAFADGSRTCGTRSA